MTTDTRSGAGREDGGGTDDGGGRGPRAAVAPGPAPHLAAFHALHHDPGHPLLLPNAWDSASALALADAGHPAIGTTSLGVAAVHGCPDGQGSPEARAATLALARQLAGRLRCPYTVDIEGGYGDDPEQVAALAAELADCGAAGINLEDGLPGDGGLQDPIRQAELIRAVKERTPGLFLNARIDTHWLVDTPPPLSEALARAETYVAAGADGIFVPGVTAEAELAVLVGGIAAPLNVLFAPGRHTVRHLADLGVRRISTGSLLFRTALGAACAAADALRTSGARPTEAGGATPTPTNGPVDDSGGAPAYDFGAVLAYGEVQRLTGGGGDDRADRADGGDHADGGDGNAWRSQAADGS